MNWARVKSWLSFKGPVKLDMSNSSSATSELKNKDIKVLENYNVKPCSSFWNGFPYKQLPSLPESAVSAEKLDVELEKVKKLLTNSEFSRGKRAVKNLIEGAPSYQMAKLPTCLVENANSTLMYGADVTDNIATWVKKGFAAGPFDCPPLGNFRVNPLIAVKQPGKVRPVLDVSRPENNSFNSNIDENMLERVKMSSAKKFGGVLFLAGKDAIMSKSDLVAAYKQVPCEITDLRLQGFRWLGKYFTETRQVFGARTSVANFDVLGDTLKVITIAKTGIPKSYIVRQLDDLAVVAPEKSGWCEKFTKEYKELCTTVGVELAENCDMKEKAFENSKRGKVLGVLFDSTDLTWSLPKEKVEKCLRAIKLAVERSSISILEFQKLMGRINDVGQMCPTMRVFRFGLNGMLQNISENPSEIIQVSNSAKEELLVWAGFLSSEFKWLPIPSPKTPPPIRCTSIFSDAAGLAVGDPVINEPGCGSIVLCEEGTIILARQITWPHNFISTEVDNKGVRFGDKSTTLELIGLLIPLISDPLLFVNKKVIFKVDNLAAIFGLENGSVKNDANASVFVRAIVLICGFLNCEIFMEHLPRKADWESKIVDNLSRKSSTTRFERKLVDSFKFDSLPTCLQRWLERPILNWQLAVELVLYVEVMLECKV